MGYPRRGKFSVSVPIDLSMMTHLQDDGLSIDIKALRFLVLDEADRMIETGHFAELDNILRLTQREFQYVRRNISSFPLTLTSIISLQKGPYRGRILLPWLVRS